MEVERERAECESFEMPRRGVEYDGGRGGQCFVVRRRFLGTEQAEAKIWRAPSPVQLRASTVYDLSHGLQSMLGPCSASTPKFRLRHIDVLRLEQVCDDSHAFLPSPHSKQSFGLPPRLLHGRSKRTLQQVIWHEQRSGAPPRHFDAVPTAERRLEAAAPLKVLFCRQRVLRVVALPAKRVVRQ
ncbi:hypothetical protein OF846_001555 [Rhodotorula toruloides]|nr:hypothetical protein OF846_001555 [Rhodotorula toruloides]